MSEHFNRDSKWGAVRVTEPEVGVIVLQSISAAVPPPVTGEPRTPSEALALWLAREAKNVNLLSIETTHCDGSIESITVRYQRKAPVSSVLRVHEDSEGVYHFQYEYDPAAYAGESVSRITTYTYDATGSLARIFEPPIARGSGEAPSEALQCEKPSQPIPGQYTLTVTNQCGQRLQRVLEARRDDPKLSPDQAARIEIAALANLVDLLPLLSSRWRIAAAGPTRWNRTTYTANEERGVVQVTPPGGEPEEIAVPPDHRLVRLTDPVTGNVSHVLEPVGHEAVWEFNTACNLVRTFPPGRSPRVV